MPCAFSSSSARGQLRRIGTADGHLGPQLAEQLGAGQADAGGTAGDDGHLVVKTDVHTHDRILLSVVPVPRKKAAGDAPVNGASPAGNARLIQLRRDQPKTPTALRMTTAIRQITEATAQGTVTYFTDCLVFRWKN